MRMRSLAAGAAMLAAGLMPAMGHSAAVVQEADYIGVIGDLTQQCTGNIGGACFDLEAGTSGVIITVDDALSTNVGVRVDFRDENGDRVGFLHGCDVIEASIPAGATRVRVAVDGPLNGPSACSTSLPNGVGTFGTIAMLAS